MWKNYFKTPFTNGFGVYIFDANGHPVANFIADMSDKSKDNIISAINGEYIPSEKHDISLSSHDDEILIDGVKALLIRGWGYLTGTGGCNLPSDKAIAVQKSLAAFICKQLSKSK